MPNEVTLEIGGEEFTYWSSLEINRPLDSISTFSLSSPFDPDVPLFRNTFEPLSYKHVELSIDGERLITGRLFVAPRITAKSVIVACTGYSLPGVLNDCELPQAKEFNDVNLQNIAGTVADPFGVDVVFNVSPGTAFDQVAATSSDKALPFLIGLAKQRGVLISDTPDGELLFFTPIESGPAVATIRQGEERLLDAAPVFNEQQYYSSVTGLSPNVIARFSESFTVVNPFLTGVERPHTFAISDTTDVDIQEAVRAKLGRMFAGAIRYEVTVQGWRDDNGDIWAPNKIIKLFAPGIMVYSEFDFIIKSVKLTRESDGGDRAKLALVLPSVYNGKAPESLPWVE